MNMRIFSVILICFFLYSCSSNDYKKETIKVQLPVEVGFFRNWYMHFQNKDEGVVFASPFCVFKTENAGKTWIDAIDMNDYVLEYNHVVINGVLYGVVSKINTAGYYHFFYYDFNKKILSFLNDSIEKDVFVDLINKNDEVSILCASDRLKECVDDSKFSFLNNSNIPIQNQILTIDDMMVYITYDKKMLVCKDETYKELYFKEKDDPYCLTYIGEKKIIIGAISPKEGGVCIYSYDIETGLLELTSKITIPSDKYVSCSNLKVLGNAIVIFVGKSYSPDEIYYSYDKGKTWKREGFHWELSLNCAVDNELLIISNENTLEKIIFNKAD